ncbi:hypothetical protein GWI33_014160 [Rhynchophorus ferrugineus]|uniref:Uncharacterized protein n=1 Tax=Rhynchophorus ferrugineus TaxID=354439 RepID=A0A834I5L2_RHYFE|nr:hypothetical protein GWI33_014160 [Rhynchophorus ferrugineus]
MRYYNLDGTYREEPEDVSFGWYLRDIVVDEAQTNYQQHNARIKDMSKLELMRARKTKKTPRKEVPKQRKIILIEPNVHEETPLSVEYYVDAKNSNIDDASYIRKISIPSKEDMIRLINPVNPEMKSLLNVLSTSRYKALKDEETKKSVFSNINYRATHSSKLLNGSGVVRKFQLNGGRRSDIFDDIRCYNATKEENMLSLMMELINTDLGSNLGDDTLSNEVSTALKQQASSSTPIKILKDQMRCLMTKTVKLNSIGCSDDVDGSLSDISPGASVMPSKEMPPERKDNVPWPMSKLKTDLLNSIGFTEDLNRSIQSFTEDKDEIQQQLDDIKDSFQEAEEKVEILLQETGDLTNDLRETIFLDNLIHLLNGDLENVKLRSLPFKVFFKDDDPDFHHNVII